MYLQEQLQKTQATKRILANLPHRIRAELLRTSAALLIKAEARILNANAKDLAQAKDLSPSMLERLELSPKTIQSMAESLRQIASFPDP